jgi:hypothetical protein
MGANETKKKHQYQGGSANDRGAVAYKAIEDDTCLASSLLH